MWLLGSENIKYWKENTIIKQTNNYEVNLEHILRISIKKK